MAKINNLVRVDYLSSSLEEVLQPTKPYRVLFERKKIQTLADILLTLPRHVLDFANQFAVQQVGHEVSLILQVLGTNENPEKRFAELYCTTTTKQFKIKVIFFEKYWVRLLDATIRKRGYATIVCHGRLVKNSTDFEKYPFTILANYLDFYRAENKTQPIYVSARADNEKIEKTVRSLLKKHTFSDLLQAYLDEHMVNLDFMLRGFHTPENVADYERSIQRFLVMCLLFFFMRRDQTVSYLLGNTVTEEEKLELAKPCQRHLGKLNFSLSTTQENAIQDILSDVGQNQPTLRYIIGDVASGKSIVAFESIASLVKSYPGHSIKTFLIAPTVILAHQHYHNFLRTYPELAAEVGLATGATKTEDLENKKIVIGTHAIFQYKKFAADLVIVDEPQKFGIEQQRWNSPTHYVFLSATPLPRWTSLLISNRLPQNVITGREKNITNVLLGYSEKTLAKIFTTIPPEFKKIIVIPKINSDLGDYPNLKEVEALLTEWEIPHGTIHGQKKDAEILATLEDFRSGKITTLLATSIIESGIDIPDVNYMTIIAPEAFGYLSLYQLVGRVGRAGERSFAYLMTYNKESLVEYVEKVRNGYDAAKLDLQKRGASVMNDQEQSGVLSIPKSEYLTPELMTVAQTVYERIPPEERSAILTELKILLNRYF